MRIDPVMIFLIALFLAGITLIVFAQVDARRERKRELANRAMAGTYRVVQTADKTFYVQKYVHDYPDCKYYLPDCESGAYTCRWHWKFLAGFSFKESALQYMEREKATDEAEAKRAAAAEKAEKERRAGLEVTKVVAEKERRAGLEVTKAVADSTDDKQTDASMNISVEHAGKWFRVSHRDNGMWSIFPTPLRELEAAKVMCIAAGKETASYGPHDVILHGMLYTVSIGTDDVTISPLPSYEPEIVSVLKETLALLHPKVGKADV